MFFSFFEASDGDAADSVCVGSVPSRPDLSLTPRLNSFICFFWLLFPLKMAKTRKFKCCFTREIDGCFFQARAPASQPLRLQKMKASLGVSASKVTFVSSAPRRKMNYRKKLQEKKQENPYVTLNY